MAEINNDIKTGMTPPVETGKSAETKKTEPGVIQGRSVTKGGKDTVDEKKFIQDTVTPTFTHKEDASHIKTSDTATKKTSPTDSAIPKDMVKIDTAIDKIETIFDEALTTDNLASMFDRRSKNIAKEIKSGAFYKEMKSLKDAGMSEKEILKTLTDIITKNLTDKEYQSRTGKTPEMKAAEILHHVLENCNERMNELFPEHSLKRESLGGSWLERKNLIHNLAFENMQARQGDYKTWMSNLKSYMTNMNSHELGSVLSESKNVFENFIELVSTHLPMGLIHSASDEKNTPELIHEFLKQHHPNLNDALILSDRSDNDIKAALEATKKEDKEVVQKKLENLIGEYHAIEAKMEKSPSNFTLEMKLEEKKKEIIEQFGIFDNMKKRKLDTTETALLQLHESRGSNSTVLHILDYYRLPESKIISDFRTQSSQIINKETEIEKLLKSGSIVAKPRDFMQFLVAGKPPLNKTTSSFYESGLNNLAQDMNTNFLQNLKTLSFDPASHKFNQDLDALMKHFEQLSEYVLDDFILAKDKESEAKIIDAYKSIAQKCVQKGEIDTAMAIYNTLDKVQLFQFHKDFAKDLETLKTGQLPNNAVPASLIVEEIKNLQEKRVEQKENLAPKHVLMEIDLQIMNLAIGLEALKNRPLPEEVTKQKSLYVTDFDVQFNAMKKNIA